MTGRFNARFPANRVVVVVVVGVLVDLVVVVAVIVVWVGMSCPADCFFPY